MSPDNRPLVLDLIEWVAREPRAYAERMDAWRTSCPRLTIWEDAVEGGYVRRETVAGVAMVVVTATGQAELARAGRRRSSRGSEDETGLGSPSRQTRPC